MLITQIMITFVSLFRHCWPELKFPINLGLKSNKNDFTSTSNQAFWFRGDLPRGDLFRLDPYFTIPSIIWKWCSISDLRAQAFLDIKFSFLLGCGKDFCFLSQDNLFFFIFYLSEMYHNSWKYQKRRKIPESSVMNHIKKLCAILAQSAEWSV